MQFKTTIITAGILFLISSLSIANPISQNETLPQKTEHTQKQKLNFIQKITLKKSIKKIDHDEERASRLSKASFWLSIISFPLAFIGVGGITALAAIITGVITLRKQEVNDKSRTFARKGIGIALAVIITAIYILGMLLLVTSALGGG